MGADGESPRQPRLNRTRSSRGARLDGVKSFEEAADDEHRDSAIGAQPLVDVRQLQVMHQLPDHVIDFMMSALQYRRVLPGDVILKQGESATHWVIIAQGMAKVHVRSRLQMGPATVRPSLRGTAIYAGDASQQLFNKNLLRRGRGGGRRMSMADMMAAGLDHNANKQEPSTIVTSAEDYQLCYNAANAKRSAEVKTKKRGVAGDTRRLSEISRIELGQVSNVMDGSADKEEAKADAPRPAALAVPADAGRRMSLQSPEELLARLNRSPQHDASAAPEDADDFFDPRRPSLAGSRRSSGIVIGGKLISPLRTRAAPSGGDAGRRNSLALPVSPREKLWDREQRAVEEAISIRHHALELQDRLEQDTAKSTAIKEEIVTRASKLYGDPVGYLLEDSCFGQDELRWDLPYSATLVALEPMYVALCPKEAYLSAVRQATSLPRIMPETHKMMCRAPAHRQDKEVAAIVELLSDTRFFKAFTRDEMKKLAGAAIRRVLPDRYCVYQQGQPIRRGSLYVVLSGSFSAHIADNEGDIPDPRSAWDEAEAMEMTESALLGTQPRSPIFKRKYLNPPSFRLDGDNGKAMPKVKKGPVPPKFPKDLDPKEAPQECLCFIGDENIKESFGSCATLLYPGDGFGERALFSVDPRSHTVIAREMSVVLEFRRGAVEAVMLERAARKALTQAPVYDPEDGFLRLVQILKIEPDKRTPEEINTLVRRTSQLRVFVDLDDERVHRHLCTKAQYQRVEPNELLVVQGEPATDLCVIVTGGVSLHMWDTQVCLDRDGTFNYEFVGPCCGLLGVGHTFGEDALLEPWAPGDPVAPCTVRAQTACTLMWMRRSDFREVASSLRKIALKQQLNDLSSVELLRAWPPYDLLRLAENLQMASFERGATLLKRGARSENVYLIRDGVVLVWQDDRRAQMRDLVCLPGRRPRALPVGRCEARGGLVGARGRSLSMPGGCLAKAPLLTPDLEIRPADEGGRLIGRLTRGALIGHLAGLAAEPSEVSVTCVTAVACWEVPISELMEHYPLEHWEKMRTELLTTGTAYAGRAAELALAEASLAGLSANGEATPRTSEDAPADVAAAARAASGLPHWPSSLQTTERVRLGTAEAEMGLDDDCDMDEDEGVFSHYGSRPHRKHDSDSEEDSENGDAFDETEALPESVRNKRERVLRSWANCTRRETERVRRITLGLPEKGSADDFPGAGFRGGAAAEDAPRIKISLGGAAATQVDDDEDDEERDKPALRRIRSRRVKGDVPDDED